MNSGKRNVRGIVRQVVSRIYRHDISRIGGELSFFIMLSVFPFLIFFNAVIASFNISPDMVNAFLSPIFPGEIISLITSYIGYISTNRSVSLLSIGIIATVFSASKAVRALNRALNTAYGIEARRSFMGEIIFSMALILVVGIVTAIMIMFMAFSTDIVEKLAQIMRISTRIVNLVDVWRWITLAAVVFFSLAALYGFVPRRRLKMRDIVPGAVFSLCGFMLLTVVFSVYVKHFASSSMLYGTIGSVILLMFWLYIVSMIIVLGAEINAVLLQNKEKK